MPLPPAAERHHAYQGQVAQAALRAARLAWAKVTLADLDGSWRAVAPGLLAVVTAAQVAAGRDADPYLAAVLAEQGTTNDPLGAVQPAAFAGVASDGRALATLLAEPLIGVKAALKARQVTPERALASQGSRLEMLSQTMTQDAGRAAVTAGVVARPHLEGYVRALRLPSCSRCAILAGRWYRWSKGFQRHPRCDCAMVPAAQADAPDLVTDPTEAARSGQVRGLSQAEEAAISDGADLNQVVNAHRDGAYQGLTTSEGVTKRGVAGKHLQGGRRLTVAGIQRVASDRAEALALLRAHGYIL